MEFDVPTARALLRDLRPRIDSYVTLRADAAELAVAVEAGSASRADLKGAAARRDEILSGLLAHGIEVKGVAPLLLDFPAVLDGVPVLLCWVEGEPELAWYHRLDLGFLGRRPLARG